MIFKNGFFLLQKGGFVGYLRSLLLHKNLGYNAILKQFNQALRDESEANWSMNV